MRGLADVLLALLRLFQQWAHLLTALPAREKTVQVQPARPREATGFGSNPGNLRMLSDEWCSHFTCIQGMPDEGW